MRTGEIFVELLRPVLQGYSVGKVTSTEQRACVDYATTQGDALAAFVNAFWKASKDTIAEIVCQDAPPKAAD